MLSKSCQKGLGPARGTREVFSAGGWRRRCLLPGRGRNLWAGSRALGWGAAVGGALGRGLGRGGGRSPSVGAGPEPLRGRDRGRRPRVGAGLSFWAGRGAVLWAGHGRGEGGALFQGGAEPGAGRGRSSVSGRSRGGVEPGAGPERPGPGSRAARLRAWLRVCGAQAGEGRSCRS